MLRALLAIAWLALTIAAAVAHEPWWDEAQAWLIARDAPLGHLLAHEVRYEGHPPLWYLLLAVPAKLGLPYASLKVAGLLGGAATALLLLYAFPSIPLYLRALAPFGLFIAYQYTVVARSYVLLGPLLLLVAWMYDRRSERPLLFTLLLILMSNVSVHGFAVACALAALFLLDVFTRRIPFPPKRAFLAGALLFVLHGVVLVLMLWPPSDNPSYTHHHSPLDPKRHSEIVTTIVPAMFWAEAEDESPLLAVAKVAAALAGLTLLVFWFFRSGAGWPFAVATLGAYAVVLRYFSHWHEGIFFFLILFGAVLAFQRGGAPRTLTVAAQLVLALLLIQHARWGVQSIAYDLRHDFTGSKDAAELIRARGLHQRVLYGTGSQIVEIQPYFEANVFDNYRANGHAYWEWSSKNTWPYPAFTESSRRDMTAFFDRLLADAPEAIVLGQGILEDELYAPRLARHPRYRRIGTFRGHTYWKDDRKWMLRFDVFERIDRPRASALRTGAR